MKARANEDATVRHRGRRSTCLASAGIAWVVAVGSGFSLLEGRAATPGGVAAPPRRWPEGSRLVPDRSRANLVLLAHPRRPCTRATLAELGRVLAGCQGTVAAHVMSPRPGGAGVAREEADLRRAAVAIPGVRARADEAGADAARFGAVTSGHALLDDPAGAPLDGGGITAAQGRAGDNPGRDAVTSPLGRGRADRGTMPVFGCPLSAPADEPTRDL